MPHVNLPKYIPLHMYLDEEALTALHQVGWLVHDEQSELKPKLEYELTIEQRKALKELAVLAQEALDKLKEREQ